MTLKLAIIYIGDMLIKLLRTIRVRIRVKAMTNASIMISIVMTTQDPGFPLQEKRTDILNEIEGL